VELGKAGVAGGAAYDAAIAAAARDRGLTLVSCDLRAAAAYERLGVSVELLA
jgi:hypothetical protein